MLGLGAGIALWLYNSGATAATNGSTVNDFDNTSTERDYSNLVIRDGRVLGGL